MFEISDNDGIVTLQMTYGKANAADEDFLQGLCAELRRLESARAVILTGQGKMFSAGVDLQKLVDGGPDYAARFAPLLDETLLQLFAFPAPLIVALNGHALAGGAIFNACGDYRLMAEGNGQLGAIELQVSVPFPLAPLEILKFALPKPVLQSHIYLARGRKPEQALAEGLVDELCEPAQLLERAQAVAAKLGKIPPAHFRMTKSALRGPTIERIRSYREAFNPPVFAEWAKPETLDQIRAYMAKLGGR